ncbi:hypothetical protein P43SY_004542 [Pythium insidiosum]|uniref:WRKY19-like zinc finger domain-containing protein n=1 Tax=Pythium insidiosum TaxID=114742 RepID=A0AAD5LN03_PYTIN|nr:hypothetical protein P43SY_004542 [Pythium insidiosum]
MTELLSVMSSDDHRFWSHPSSRPHIAPTHRPAAPVMMTVPAAYSYNTQHGAMPLVISVPAPRNLVLPPQPPQQMYLVPQEILAQGSGYPPQPLRATARNVFAVFPAPQAPLVPAPSHNQAGSEELDDVRFLQELLLSPCTADDAKFSGNLSGLGSHTTHDSHEVPHASSEPSCGSLQALLQTVQMQSEDTLSTGSASSSPTNLMSSSRRTRQLPPSRVCRVPGCTKGIRSRGLCKGHGGGRRCTTPGCTISDQGGGHCIAHGGGKRCSVDGCDKSAQYKGLCKVHGGSRRCRYPDCSKNGQVRGLCRVHFSLVGNADGTISE